nr:hypothetical protein [uncultured Sphingomonas sp.]
MRKLLIENAAVEVAHQVRAVEDSIEHALEEIAELQARMIRARATAGVATSTGHEALQELANATISLVSARGGMANCHSILKDTTQKVPGLRTFGFGEGSECPPAQAAQTLRIVA